MDRIDRAGDHALPHPLRHRRAGGGGELAPLARRGVPALPARDERLRALVPRRSGARDGRRPRDRRGRASRAAPPARDPRQPRDPPPPRAGEGPGREGGVRGRAAARADRARPREAERAALRGPARVLRAGPGAPAQVQLLLLAPRCRDARRGRGGDARPHVRARPDRGRPGDPRSRLRLGVVRALRRRAVPESADHGGLELALAARVDRGARARQCRGRHRRRERARARPPLRPRRLDRDVRAHAELRGVDGAPGGVAGAGRCPLRAPLLPPRARLSLRRGVDGEKVLHRRDDALGRPPSPSSAAISVSSSAGS